ncbi:PREDICTED: E4 SUMO-protein ligase PIAL1-like isoform X2 [Camelina sativa]|uniref:E4 SUMO-protein ligase PIAL1-like isoform X2 n=1 Tax=Camelina sativa TaxID=90675 RepID=A0ABM0WSY7_CAMSA|nr:PREDICTED: E4 SUMO-protein ligase PIAL1-like isoform X2 [Camelina sativa]
MVIPANSGFGFRAELSTKEFQDSCISLAKEIDAAVGKNEVPGNVQELALVLNYVCHRICDDLQTRAVVMTLMISAKSACQLGWFPQTETQKLLAIIDLMSNSFSNPEIVTPSVDSPVSLISEVIERFYPCVKLGHIVLSCEAKPELKILVKDFHISKKMPHSLKQKVGLFVVRTEDISKSNCIVHPQKVSFLLNGKGVDKRVNISMESGPQLPTDVTALVNAGANLLQAIGCFGGSYLIAIAFIDLIPLPDKPLLKDYVHPEVIESNSDCDIIEGPSRISLSCPISRTRIKLPVKGHVCKHLQCFDFWNYVNMNLRRPSWRCPHCNQSVCYTDIRVDQKLKKILEEVRHSATDVVITADGSWTVVTENDEDVELVPEATHDHGDPNSFINLGPTVFDLPRDENEMETSSGTQVHEQNLGLSEIQAPSATDYTMLNQSSASINTLPQLPQSLNAFDGQQFLPSSSPQDRLATNASNFGTSMPVAQSSQFQGSHVMPLENCVGRTSDLMERWNLIHGRGINQTQLPSAPLSQHHYAMQNLSQYPSQHRPIPSYIAHPQTLPVNYGGNADQRSMPPMQPSITHLQSLLNYGGNAHRRPMPSSITRSHTLPVSYGGNVHQRSMPSSFTHLQTLPVNYGGTADQRTIPSSMSHINYGGTADQRTIPSSMSHIQNLPVNYGGTSDQRPMLRPMPSSNTHLPTSSVNYGGTNDQRHNPGGARGQLSSREFMNLPPANTANWRQPSRMRGSIEPGTRYDHMIIRPTRPVQAQAQTLPPPQSTADNVTNESQAFLLSPSYPIGTNETQVGTSSLPVAEALGLSGSFWSMPPETW